MQTTDYSRFKLLHSNRQISRGLVDRLKGSIEKIGFQKSREILVNDKFEIIDGQHRFTACQELGIPVPYQIRERNRISDNDIMIELNSKQNVWRLSEYIGHYAKEGVRCYKYILEFEEKYHLGISNSISICLDNKNDFDKIKKGISMPINPKADDIAEFILACKLLPFHKKSHFVYAVVVMFRKAKKKDIDKVLKKHTSMTQQPSRQAYMNLFCNIINKNKPEALHISLQH